MPTRWHGWSRRWRGWDADAASVGEDLRRHVAGGHAEVVRWARGRGPGSPRGGSLSGHLFIFFNRRGDLAKMLWWSNGGLCLFAKRLERGRFRWSRPVEAGTRSVQIDATDLALLLEGVDLSRARRQPWWNPPRKRAA